MNGSRCSEGASFVPTLSDEPPEIERIIFIETCKVGYLIGHHGRTIYGFEHTTGAKIDIMAPNSKDSETPVKISGAGASVRHALRLIMDLYAFNSYSGQIWQNPQTNDTFIVAQKDEIVATEEMMVSVQFATFLVQNEHICYIEAHSGAKILVCRQSSENAKEVPLNIVGKAECNALAVQLIEEYHKDFHSSSSLMEAYANLPPLIFVDNPYKKFGLPLKNYRPKPSYDSNGFPRKGSDPNLVNWISTQNEEGRYATDSCETTLELITFKPNFDIILLHPICHYNKVTMETFIVDAKQISGESKESEGPTDGRKVVIRGLEPNVKNAKLDLLRAIELASEKNF